MTSIKGCKRSINRTNKYCVQTCEEEMSISYMNHTTKTQWPTFIELVKVIDTKFDILNKEYRKNIGSLKNLYSSRNSLDNGNMWFKIACDKNSINVQN